MSETTHQTPLIYDVSVDEYRSVTQADINALMAMTLRYMRLKDAAQTISLNENGWGVAALQRLAREALA